MDALTPTFATCNLNYSVPKDTASVDNQSFSPRPRNPPRHAAHFTGNSVTQNRDSATTNANTFDGSGAESSGYHSASSLSTASSDSEYSDSEAGQTVRLRYFIIRNTFSFSTLSLKEKFYSKDTQTMNT